MEDIASLGFLVVDHEISILTLSVHILHQLGATEVATASNGAEALEFIDGEVRSPDVMLIDLAMPGMGGAELLRGLAERSYPGSVILVSGADEEALAFAQGLAVHWGTNVLGYITKPVSPKQLRDMMAKLD